MSTLVEELNDLLCFSDVVWLIKQRNDPVWQTLRKWKLLPHILLNFFGDRVIVYGFNVRLLFLFDVLDLVRDSVIIIKQLNLRIFGFQIKSFFVIDQFNRVKTDELMLCYFLSDAFGCNLI